MDWSADAKCLLICQFTQAVQQLYLFDLSTRELTKLSHPGGTFDSPGTYFASGDEIYAQWQDATHPAQLIALHAQTGMKKRTILAAELAIPGIHRLRCWTEGNLIGVMPQGDDIRLRICVFIIAIVAI